MTLEQLSMSLWFIFFGFSVLFGVIMVRKALAQGIGRSQREYFLGIAIFIIVHLIARIFYFYYDFIYIEDIFFWHLGAVVGVAGIIFLLYAIERNIYTRTKFLFTILAIIYIILLLTVLNLGWGENVENTLQTIFIAIIGPFIPLIYIYVAYKSSGEIRRNSLLIAFGIVIFIAGQTAHGRTFFAITHPVYLIVSPILMLIGGILFLSGLIKT